MICNVQPDSLIFDMDGTLWDATDSYVMAWNEGLKSANRIETVNNYELNSIMGLERDKVFKKLFPTLSMADYDDVYAAICKAQDRIIPQKCGVFYPFVREGIKILSQKYKIFVLSNCAALTIKQMIVCGNLEKYITDEIAHGFNYKPKWFNINLLVEKYGLKTPLYIGDTSSDEQQCKIAKIPFALVTYGFGTSKNYDYKFDSFKELTTHFLTIA